MTDRDAAERLEEIAQRLEARLRIAIYCGLTAGGTVLTDAIYRALQAARADERAKVRREAWEAHVTLTGGHQKECDWRCRGGQCNCEYERRYKEARAYLDACAAEAAK